MAHYQIIALQELKTDSFASHRGSQHARALFPLGEAAYKLPKSLADDGTTQFIENISLCEKIEQKVVTSQLDLHAAMVASS